MGLFHPPFDLHDYQARFVAECYLRGSVMLAADMGMGKSVMAIALACLLVEDGLVDQVVIECESNKLSEWEDDLAAHSDLPCGMYHGTAKRRETMRADLPAVIVSTFETMRTDSGHLVTAKGKRKSLSEGPLFEALRGRRVLWVSDEAPVKVGASRSSLMYRTRDALFKEIRRSGELRLLILSATPMDRDPQGFFNLARLVKPGILTVDDFDVYYVGRRDLQHRPIGFKNLTASECASGVTPLREVMSSILLTKKKTDPDVVDLFPKMPEPDFTYVRLEPRHQEFYEAVADLYAGVDDWSARSGFVTLRQVASIPESLTRSQGEVARSLVEAVGVAGLRKLGSSKLDALSGLLGVLCKGQGAQAVVFTFFGQSVLPLVQQRLIDEGIRVVVNHGQMSERERDESKRRFRSGQADVFLTSDAGARGINLPEAQYVIQFDAALTHANYLQRINRIHRLDSAHAVVFAHTLVVRDTVEEGIVSLGLRRHEWHDDLLSDEEDGSSFLSVDMQRRLMRLRRG